MGDDSAVVECHEAPDYGQSSILPACKVLTLWYPLCSVIYACGWAVAFEAEMVLVLVMALSARASSVYHFVNDVTLDFRFRYTHGRSTCGKGDFFPREYLASRSKSGAGAFHRE